MAKGCVVFLLACGHLDSGKTVWDSEHASSSWWAMRGLAPAALPLAAPRLFPRAHQHRTHLIKWIGVCVCVSRKASAGKVMIIFICIMCVSVCASYKDTHTWRSDTNRPRQSSHFHLHSRGDFLKRNHQWLKRKKMGLELYN